MNSFRATAECFKAVRTLVRCQQVRPLSVTALRSARDPKLQKLYEKFQEPVELPVHLLGGPRDYVLLYSTYTLAFFCSIFTFRFWYYSIFPEKPRFQ